MDNELDDLSLSQKPQEAAAEQLDAQGWGRLRKDYYDADTIENQDDALEEEEEALGLQQRLLQSMTDADFGLGESDWPEPLNATENSGHKIATLEDLPRSKLSHSMTIETRTKMLRNRYPELLLLTKEFLSLQPRLERLRQELTPMKKQGQTLQSQMYLTAMTKFLALSAYLAAHSMYFALLSAGSRSAESSGAALPAGQLREHSIMNHLVRCRATWLAVEGVGQSPEIKAGKERRQEDRAKPAAVERDLKREVEREDQSLNHSAATKKKTRRKSRAYGAAEEALADASAQRWERFSKMKASLARLAADEDTHQNRLSRKPQVINPADNDDSDFGEETALSKQEAAEKAKRKKSLRFYTAQIAQKAHKRDLARRNAGGDTDVPYRERFRDRQIRLGEEAERRGQKQMGNVDVSLSNGMDAAGSATATDLRQVADDDYYEQVAMLTKMRAAEKEGRARAWQEAVTMPRGSLRRDEAIGPDGKRAISYAIEKNKGVAPASKRKSIRNPRVKKRSRYEEKLKKLSSVRPVYSGGEGRGGYGGELTGVKTHLVKSIKL